MVQWYTVRLMLILQCILNFQVQSINFTDAFSQEDISSGEPFLIEIPRGFKSNGRKCGIVFRLNESEYGQSEAASLW